MKIPCVILVFACVFHLTNATIAPKDKSSKKQERKASDQARRSQSANLSTSSKDASEKLSPEQLSVQELLGQNMSDVSSKERTYPQSVLSYVTPWNNKGYDFAKEFAYKMDMVSPVWYQIKRLNGKVEFAGLSLIS